MATHEEELRKIVGSIELLEAEQESNVEEIQRITPPGMCRMEGYGKRLVYLQKRNAYLEKSLKELREKRKSKVEVIEWDRRTM